MPAVASPSPVAAILAHRWCWRIGGQERNVVVAPDGSWRYTLTDADYDAMAANPSQTLLASQTDAAGDTGFATRNIVVDVLAPAAPTIAFISDRLINAGDIATNAGLTITGSAETGASKVRLRIGNVLVREVVPSNLNWTYTLPTDEIKLLPQGPVTITATAIDAANNASQESTAQTISIAQPCHPWRQPSSP